MATLDGALALIQVHHIALAVAHHLDFDVPWLFNELFNKHAVIAKAITRLVATTGEALKRFCIAIGDAQAFTATASAGFDHDGIANIPRDFHSGIRVFDRIVPTGNGVHTGVIRQFL